MSKRAGIMLSSFPIDYKLRNRFWSKVGMKDADDCWLWKASFGFRNYGKFKVGGTYVAAHRVAYYLHYGSFDETMQVCHKCDNPSCVNPNHLFLGTASDNNMDKIKKGRHRFISPWGSEFNKQHRWGG